MIIWINGPFGVGKTAVAKTLAKMWPEARILDPEKIGFRLQWEMRFKSLFIFKKVPSDFQDIPEWRKRTLEEILFRLKVRQWPVIVPMTLVNATYFKEILAPLCEATDVYHFSLVAKPTTIRKRINRKFASQSSKKWAISQIETCLEALKKPLFAMNIDTEDRTRSQIAKDIVSRL